MLLLFLMLLLDAACDASLFQDAIATWYLHEGLMKKLQQEPWIVNDVKLGNM